MFTYKKRLERIFRNNMLSFILNDFFVKLTKSDSNFVLVSVIKIIILSYFRRFLGPKLQILGFTK